MNASTPEPPPNGGYNLWKHISDVELIVQRKWEVDCSPNHANDRHYILWRGKWRHVPRWTQRVWERYAARVFGSSCTSTVYGDGTTWTGGIRV